MDVMDAISKRRSVRAYASEPPSKDALLRLIDAAIHAPCAANRQSWFFTILRDRKLLAEMSSAAKDFMTRTRPLALPEHLYEKLADPMFDVFYGAPALVVISGPAGAPWIAEDCALAAQNMMLAAHGAGLGTCWIGLAQPWLASPKGRRVLALAEGLTPLAPIIVGRPSAAHAPSDSARKPPEIAWL